MLQTEEAPPRLWSRRYGLWFVSDTTADFSRALAAFAVPLLALMLTDDPALAGVLAATGLAVGLIATLIGGIIADRRDRVTLMLVGSAVGTVLAAGFTALALTDTLSYAALFAIEVLLAARGGVFGVGGQAALKDIVPDAALGRAQAANQGRDAVLSLAASPAGGAMLAVGGWLVGAVMTASQLIATVSAAMLRRGSASRLPAQPMRAAERSGIAELLEAARWVFRRTDLRGTILVSTVINLGINVTITTAVYALQQQGESATVIGLVSAGVGVGMLVGAGLAPLLIPRVPAGVIACIALFGIVTATAVLPFATSPVAVAATLAAGMFFAPSVNAALLGYFMVAVPPSMIGRATSVAQVFAMGAMPLAPLVAGLGLAWWGRTTTMLAAAVVCVIALVIALVDPALRRVPRERDWAGHAAEHAR